MDTLDAIILGVIQGFTEFLPVSSSGHLEIGKVLLGVEASKESPYRMLFTVIVHFATALSTLVVFRKDILSILSGIFSKKKEDVDFTGKIILSMLPAVIIGLFFEDQLDALFDGNIILVGSMLILTGFLLFLAGRAKNTDKDISWKNAFVIGVSQAVAMLPGISRSGATISTSVILGNDRTKAARFSFLMVVPLIFGKIAKEILGGELALEGHSSTPLYIGFIAAFITGLLACTWMIALVKKAKLHYFSYYCFAVGLIAITAGLLTL